ncbi:SAM-dependent methyltransferase [Streptomyces sp. NPDC002884]|uniref:SAM-dependent methyltransferase n=1 Tax=Streptomyces sp. NPDC002884 TaxID=3154544 RepID=UPI00331BDB73
MPHDAPAVDAATRSPRARIDTTRPHTARIWNYRLGGRDSHEADRRASGTGPNRRRSRCPAGWRAGTELINSAVNAAERSHVWR